MGKATPLFDPIGIDITKKTYNKLSGKDKRQEEARTAAIQAEEDRKRLEAEEAKQALLHEQATVDRPFGNTEVLDLRRKRKSLNSSSLGIL